MVKPIITILTAAGICLVNSTVSGKDDAAAPGKDEAVSMSVAELMLNRSVVLEFDARNITLLEACERLNKALQPHRVGLRDVFPNAAKVSVTVDKDAEIAGEAVFLHVKKITLKTILTILCEQNYLVYKIEGNTIKIEHSGSD